MKKLLSLPATLTVVALALPGCPMEPEPEPEHEICFCELPPPRDAGSFTDAEVGDSGCTPPSERTCAVV